MKKFFLDIRNKLEHFHCEHVFISGCFILLFIFLTATLTAYFSVFKWILSSECVNEEKYKQYEIVIQQVLNEGVAKITLPKNAKLDINYEARKICVKNLRTYYSVTGDFSNEKLKFTRESGAYSQILDSIAWGAVFLMALLAISYAWCEFFERRKYHLTL